MIITLINSQMVRDISITDNEIIMKVDDEIIIIINKHNYNKSNKV